MNHVNNQQRIFNQRRSETKASISFPLYTWYMDYAERQNEEGIWWYMKVIIAIPCVYMILSIIAMAMVTTNYIWFVGLCMILFFSNVIVHIAEAKSTFYIPLYHFTLALFVLIPFITYLINF